MRIKLCHLIAGKLSNHTNHAEVLNKVMAAKNKISLKTQLKHIYSEDRRRAYKHLADSSGSMRERLAAKKLNAHQASPSSLPNLVGRYVMHVSKARE